MLVEVMEDVQCGGGGASQMIGVDVDSVGCGGGSGTVEDTRDDRG